MPAVEAEVCGAYNIPSLDPKQAAGIAPESPAMDGHNLCNAKRGPGRPYTTPVQPS